MNVDAGIKFTKRLDEINGKITIGRRAASASPWNVLGAEPQKSHAQVKIAKIVAKKVASKTVEEVAKQVAGPAISGDLDLELKNVFFKKPYDQGTFSGSAKTVDGIIEEIYISMPNGQNVEINTRDRMTGNVFQYEDTQTREMKSGLFYEVKKGTYMITLTDDSQFPGARFEFTALNSEVGYNEDYYSAQESWEMDQQNNNDELAGGQDYNQGYDDQPANDYPAEYDNGQEGPSYGFNFQS